MLLGDNLTPLTSPSLPEGYTLAVGVPTIEVYRHLRQASGLSPKSAQQAAPVAANSWYAVQILHSGSAVAMGRIISDGGWYFHLADMATLPDHQGRGLASVVLAELLARIKDYTTPMEGTPYVCLMADPPGQKLYKKFGFVMSAPSSEGMVLKLK